MTSCKKCGASLQDGVRFCPSCGTPTQNDETQIIQAAHDDTAIVTDSTQIIDRDGDVEEHSDEAEQSMQIAANTGGNKRVIIGIVAGVIVAAAIICFFVLRNQHQQDQTQPNNSVTPVPDAITKSDGEEVDNYVTPDLTLLDVHGPVETLTTPDNQTIKFDAVGNAVNIDDFCPGAKRNSQGYITSYSVGNRVVTYFFDGSKYTGVKDESTEFRFTHNADGTQRAVRITSPNNPGVVGTVSYDEYVFDTPYHNWTSRRAISLITSEYFDEPMRDTTYEYRTILYR